MINDPAVVAEIEALHEKYEAALVSNDVNALIGFFWDSPHALRFGVNESLYGAKEIEEFRKNRPPIDLTRTVSNLKIVTFGNDCAIVTLEFDRMGSNRHGRQGQVWRRFEDGWKIVSAHVSLTPVSYVDLASELIGLPITTGHREGVRRNIDRAAVIAKPLLELNLENETEPAPDFTP